MSSKYTQVSLTYSVGEEQLVTAGSYKSAVARVKNGNCKDKKQKGLKWYQKAPGHYVKGKEELFIDQPMKVNKPAEYAQGRCKVTLGKAFIDNALEAPKKSNRMTNDQWNLLRNWKSMSEIDKIGHQVEQYVKDIGGFDAEFSID